MQLSPQPIVRYIDSLLREGVLLSIHFSGTQVALLPPDSIDFLYPYNNHAIAYCTHIKGNCRPACLEANRCAIARCAKEEAFSAVCHADMLEYHRGFSRNGQIVGVVSVSGWQAPVPTRRKTDEEAALYTLLAPPPENFDALDAKIAPLCIMLTAYLEQLPLLDTPSPSHAEFRQLLLYLNENHTRVSLDELCAVFHRSRSHLSHLFQKHAGCSLHAYCNRLRVQDAEILLCSTTLSVTAIAQMLGFSDAAYFVRVFRAANGITPLAFRRAHTMSSG